jgi:hypothetical protein
LYWLVIGITSFSLLHKMAAHRHEEKTQQCRTASSLSLSRHNPPLAERIYKVGMLLGLTSHTTSIDRQWGTAERCQEPSSSSSTLSWVFISFDLCTLLYSSSELCALFYFLLNSVLCSMLSWNLPNALLLFLNSYMGIPFFWSLYFVLFSYELCTLLYFLLNSVLVQFASELCTLYFIMNFVLCSMFSWNLPGPLLILLNSGMGIAFFWNLCYIFYLTLHFVLFSSELCTLFYFLLNSVLSCTGTLYSWVLISPELCMGLCFLLNYVFW